MEDGDAADSVLCLCGRFSSDLAWGWWIPGRLRSLLAQGKTKINIFLSSFFILNIF